jgi:hypothetical protein
LPGAPKLGCGFSLWNRASIDVATTRLLGDKIAFRQTAGTTGGIVIGDCAEWTRVRLVVTGGTWYVEWKTAKDKKAQSIEGTGAATSAGGISFGFDADQTASGATFRNMTAKKLK